jgi:hypothetical protein
VPAVIGTAVSSDWSSGGALLTFFFPVVLFVVVATTLYLQFSRPHTVPGQRPPTVARASAAAAGQEQQATVGDGDRDQPEAPEADA